jgi:hypothetical protein
MNLSLCAFNVKRHDRGVALVVGKMFTRINAAWDYREDFRLPENRTEELVRMSPPFNSAFEQQLCTLLFDAEGSARPLAMAAMLSRERDL